MAIQHFRKLISSFYKDHLNKPIATFKAINIILLMARLIIKLTIKSIAKTAIRLLKQKQDQPANNTNK